MNSTNQIQQTLSHSRFGIASFVISISSGCALWVLALLTSILKASMPERLPSTAAMMLGSLMLFCFLASCVGLVLGIIAYRETARKRTLTVIGLAVNGLMVLLFLIMLVRMNLLGTIIENFLVAWAYTLPAMLIGFAVLYFSYIKKAKLSWKYILQGFVITWAIFAFPVLLFGENSLDTGYLILPIIIGFIVFYTLRRSLEKRSSKPEEVGPAITSDKV